MTVTTEADARAASSAAAPANASAPASEPGAAQAPAGSAPALAAEAVDAFVADLASALDADRVLRDPESLARYSHDDAEWAPFEAPLAVVLARSTDEVSAVLRLAAASGVRVVPRGAGTGLSGGANAVADCVVLSLELMDAVTEIDVDERYAVVQPGVINDALRAAVAEHGLWYPPDPASSAISTIGGNVATNAGGICCVKYGVTRDYVLGLTVVLADGSIVELGGAPPRASPATTSSA